MVVSSRFHIWYFVSLQGVFSVENEDRRVLLQAVHEIFDKQTTTPWQPDEKRVSRLVFIGTKSNIELKNAPSASLVRTEQWCRVCDCFTRARARDKFQAGNPSVVQIPLLSRMSTHLERIRIFPLKFGSK